MKLKTKEIDGTTYAIVQDGHPVYEADDGKEIPFDAPHAMSTIAARNNEAKQLREQKEAAEAKAKKFEGLDDPDEARAALKTVQDLKDAQLVEAGKVDEIKQAAIDQTKKAFEPLQAENATLRKSLNEHKIGDQFTNSPFIKDKLAVPASIARSIFGSHFSIADDGTMTVKGHDGNQVFSPDPQRAGEPANFEEAIEHLVNGHADKKSILKGTGHRGSGADKDDLPSGGRGTGGNLSGIAVTDRTARQSAIADKFPDLPAS